jgi:hypothetical protein
VIHRDLEAQLSPKLTAKQREAPMKQIDAAAAKREEEAANSCRGAMLGKVADPKALKCALDAKTAKEYDVCLNGEAAPAKP